ncbi:MAG: hypothetical protein ACREDR_01890 [Blastocatellia bacterium]
MFINPHQLIQLGPLQLIERVVAIFRKQVAQKGLLVGGKREFGERQHIFVRKSVDRHFGYNRLEPIRENLFDPAAGLLSNARCLTRDLIRYFDCHLATHDFVRILKRILVPFVIEHQQPCQRS